MRTPAVAGRALLVGALVVLAACNDEVEEGTRQDPPPAPPEGAVLSGDPPPQASEAVERILTEPGEPPPARAVAQIGRAGDLRYGWLLLDLLRVWDAEPSSAVLVEELEALAGVETPQDVDPWAFHLDLLAAWDVPEPPGYPDAKRLLLGAQAPGWAVVADLDAPLDWRFVAPSHPGVETPVALEDPEVVAAEGPGSWLPDDDAVVVVDVGGHHRAYPLRVLQVHELVVDTVAGRRVAISHCPSCGTTVAFFAEHPEPAAEDAGVLEVRSTGLLHRGTRLLWEVTTGSLLEDLRVEAIAGELSSVGARLRPVPVTVTSWGAWREAHPDTEVVAEDAGIGRVYVADPLGPRPAAGMPVGPVDGQLPALEDVFGVEARDGTVVAVPVAEARDALVRQPKVVVGRVRIALDGGGLLAYDDDTGELLPGRHATWSAWVRSHPDLVLWRDQEAGG